MYFYGRFIVPSVLGAALLYYLLQKRRNFRRVSIRDLHKVTGPILEEISEYNICSEVAVVDLTDDIDCIAYTNPLPAYSVAVVLCSNLITLNPLECPLTSVSPEPLEMINRSTERNVIETPLLMSSVNTDSVSFKRPVGSGSESENAHTPDSNELASSPEPHGCVNLPPGCFNDPKNDIYEDIPEDMNGTMVPKVLIPSDMWAEAVDKDIWHETFCVPAHMGGVLIGRLGKNVRELRNIWQAEFCLNTYPGRQDTLIFKLSCPVKHKNDVLQWVSRRFRMRPSRTTIGNPDQLKRYLPLGQPVPVQVRSLYASKELFVSIHDAEYGRYLKVQEEIDKDYTSNTSFRMQLCEPVTSGTIAIVPHSYGFARALILSVYTTWPKVVLYFLLDHGTFGVTPLNKLRKIRAKYMRVPFQAIHVSWAHAFPVFSDIPDIHILRTFFSNGRAHAFAVRMETCCRASVAFGEPYCHPYSNQGFLDVLVTACNSGLYMAAPLALYPNRQCWLNGTDTPYYPFTYSAVDYNALVNYLPEAVEEPVSNAGATVPRPFDKTRHHEFSARNRQGRGRSGAAYWHNQRPSNFSNPQKSSTSQKENQIQSTNSSQTYKSDTNAPQFEHIPKAISNEAERRRPLGARNYRSNGSTPRGSYSRGRGGSLQSRQ